MDEAAEGWRPLRAPARPRGLGTSPFARLALAHALAVAGDALVTMALAGSLFFSISPNAARGRVALSLVLTIAPFAVVAPFLGPAIDRWRGGQRVMVFGAAAGRAVTCLVMANVVDQLLLFPAAFASLVLSKTHAVAKSSLVPTVVRSDEELVEANSKLALISVVMGFLAAVPGVPVLQLAGAEWVLRLGAVVFGASAVAALRLAPAPPGPGPEEAEEAGRPVTTQPVAPGIAAAAVAMAGLRAAVGFLTFLAAFSLRRAGAPSWVFGLVLAASLGGTMAGAALAPRLRQSDRITEERLLTGSLALVAVAGLVATRLAARPASVVLAAVLGAAASAGKLAFDAIVQRDAPSSHRGRQFARFEAAFQLTWVVGALVPVVIPMPTPVGATVLGAGAATLAGFYVTSRRRPA